MFNLPSLSARLAGIVRDALGVLARLGPKGAASGPVLMAISASIQRRLLRFERLMARVAAGRPAPVRRKTEERAKRAGVRRVNLVPRGHAWAVKMAQGTAVFGSQLQALLAEPGVAELLRDTPEAGAILRPLFRMLGAELPEALQVPGQGPRPPRVRRVARVGRFPGDEGWPGVRIWRERFEASIFAGYMRKTGWRPP